MDKDPVSVLVAEMEVTARQLAALHAVQLRQLVEYAALTGRDEYVADELALILHTTIRTADNRLELALDLTNRLPATLAALDAGDLDLTRAQVIAEVTSPLTPEMAHAIEDHLLPAAFEQNPGQLRRAASKAIQLADPAGAEERHQRRREGRRVEIWPDTEGMAELYALLPAEDAMRIKVRLDAYAKAQPKSDKRTMDQRRADILVDLTLSRSLGSVDAVVHVTAPATVLASTSPGTRRARASRNGQPRTARTHTTTAPETTSLTQAAPGTADEAVPATSSTAEHESAGLGAGAELAGYGVITGSQARLLAAHDATWRRLLTDPATGVLTDYGKNTYTPPAALAAFVRARDQYCVSRAAMSAQQGATSIIGYHSRRAQQAPRISHQFAGTITG